MAVYIQSANQISAQKPLSDEWFEHPVFYDQKRVQTIDPDFTVYFQAMTARRMCKMLKRAVVLSRQTLKEATVEMPDAIISGTGLGCIENTEKFMLSISENDEKMLQPTYFMQSTHNIFSSTIAIDLKCHGYNNTFVHRGVSFENALLDAILQFEQKRIQNALVGGYDELTDNYYVLFDRMGWWNFQPGLPPQQSCFAGEAAANMLLSATKTELSIGEVKGIELMYKPDSEQFRQTLDKMLAKAGCQLSDVDAILTGMNTNLANDAPYHDAITHFFGELPILHYKHLFGESFSSSALGVYVAITCLRKGQIPAFLLSDAADFSVGNDDTALNGVKRILFYNHYSNQSHSLILLSSCSD